MRFLDILNNIIRIQIILFMNIYVIAALISCVYLFTKIMEMNFIEEEQRKPIKIMVCDSLVVYFSVLVGYFIYNQVALPMEDVDIPPEIFTDSPDF